MSSVLDRLLRYTAIETTSDYKFQIYPSTKTQLAFGKLLCEECKELGLSDVKMDDYGYVTAALPANAEGYPAIGFLAHMDTSPDAPGHDIHPQVLVNYDGKDIPLNGITLSPAEFPSLKDYIGQTLVTSDGTTLLGADDKAGIAEILTAMEYFLAHPEIPHGKVCIAFTPDEEIGHGVDYFDVPAFGADFAYTLDGGPLGELEYENFNAARVDIKIKGKGVHPGTAKGIMLNAALIAAEYASLLPADETPATTEHYEGFYHLHQMEGEVTDAFLSYIIRDFDADGFEKRQAHMRDLAEKLAQKHQTEINVTITEQYRNMREVVEKRMEIIDLAAKAMRDAGVTPIINPIRGGTDGSRLSFMGLPCPNIFSGGHNFHGPYEYVPVSSMEKAVEVIVGIIRSANTIQK